MAAVLEHLNHKVNPLASSNESSFGLDRRPMRKVPSSSSPSLVPRVYTASMEELMGIVVGLTWLGVQ
jgi:hypothetical protein